MIEFTHPRGARTASTFSRNHQGRFVLKFGGSNLKGKADYARVVQAIKQYDHPVVVVSALYGITNLLDDTLQGRIEVAEGMSQIARRHKEAIEELVTSPEAQTASLLSLTSTLQELDRLFKGVALLGRLPDCVHDLVMSFGERLSAQLLADMLRQQELPARLVLPEAMPLQTNGEFRQASVDFVQSEAQVIAALPENEICVVPGFYGVSPSGEVNLFGRGGSDYSAAAIARCIGAASVDIWKDVDGFLSADPRMISEAIAIHQLTFEEAAELAYFGAKILHPACIEPCAEAGIPLRLINIERGAEAVPRTVIAAGAAQASGVKSVTQSEDFALVKLTGSALGVQAGVLARVTAALDQIRVNIKSVITSQIAINLLLSRHDAERALAQIQALRLPSIGEASIDRDVAVVAAVGDGITTTPGIAARMFTAIAENQINTEMIAFGASPVSAYFIVRPENRQAAVKAIHNEFFFENAH